MASYVINYNPYQNKTTVIRNGVKLTANKSLVKNLSGKRLQSWFDCTNGWPGLEKAIIDDNNEKTCDISFQGREMDYEDLKDAFDEINARNCKNGGTVFNVSANILTNDTNILDKLETAVDLMRKSKLFSKKQMEDINKSIKNLKEERFVISVIATMSSGKSTLLNALMHKEILPSGDDATTANIVEIYDNDQKTVEIEGFNQDGECVLSRREAKNGQIIDINDNKSIKLLKVFSDIPSVSMGRMPLMLRDTPGPNNSMDRSHRELTDAIIKDAKNMSTVIYVMNGTNLRVDSDKELLACIADEMKKGGKQANDRFLFVINKVDQRLSKKEQTLQKLIEDARTYLGEFGITNPRIFPVSALMGQNIWKSRAGYEFDEIFEPFESRISLFNKDDQRVKFDEFASTTASVRKKLAKEISEAEKNIKQGKYEIALIHSGIKGFEHSITEYVEKYAYPIKVFEAVNEIQDTIDEEKMRRKFLDAIAGDEEALSKLEKKLEELAQKKEERLVGKKKFQEKINNFKISEKVKIDARQSVNSSFTDIIDKERTKISGSNKLTKEEAKKIVDELSTNISEKEKTLEKELVEAVNNDIVSKSNDMLTEYRNYLASIKEDIKFDKYDLEKVKELKKCSFESIEEVSEKVSEVHKIEKPVMDWIPNKNHRWYHNFLFWRKDLKKEIWGDTGKKEFVEEIEYVDKEKMKNKLLEISINARENVDDLIAEAEDRILDYKKYFNKQINKLDSVVDGILDELAVVARETQKKTDEKENQKQNEIVLNSIIDEVNKITEIEGVTQ